MQPPQSDLERIALLLESQEWVFAKTMPDNPHWYTPRKTWADPQAFVEAVEFIRQYGVVERYPDPVKGRPYTVLVVRGFKYWTMGWPAEQTVLINRKPVPAQG